MKRNVFLMMMSLAAWLCLPVIHGSADDEKSTKDLVKIADDIINEITQDEKKIEIKRDPFSTSQGGSTTPTGDGVYEFFPLDASTRLPKLALRGYIDDDNGDPMALLDITNHGVFLVKVGDTVGINLSGRNTVLKVKKISNLSVLVEVGTIGQVVIVR